MNWPLVSHWTQQQQLGLPPQLVHIRGVEEVPEREQFIHQRQKAVLVTKCSQLCSSWRFLKRPHCVIRLPLVLNSARRVGRVDDFSMCLDSSAVSRIISCPSATRYGCADCLRWTTLSKSSPVSSNRFTLSICSRCAETCVFSCSSFIHLNMHKVSTWACIVTQLKMTAKYAERSIPLNVSF